MYTCVHMRINYIVVIQHLHASVRVLKLAALRRRHKPLHFVRQRLAQQHRKEPELGPRQQRFTSAAIAHKSELSFPPKPAWSSRPAWRAGEQQRHGLSPP